jgi:hypothetical protein
MPGARCARSLACNIKKHTSIVTTVTPEITRHSPRNGFNGLYVLSPVTGLVCHRRPREVAFRELDTSVGVSGPHAFAVRLKRRSSVSASASTASRPASVTLRNAPLWDRTAEILEVICPTREAKYFCKRDWTRDNRKTN